MATIMGSIVKNTTDINDEIIADNMLASAAAAANAYLNATMTCATPELRTMFSSSLNQVVTGHSALTELTVHKGWNNPYTPPTVQLSETYNKSTTVVTPK